MATINYTAPGGTQHRLPLAEGQDPNQVVATFEAANFSSLGESIDSGIPETAPSLTTGAPEEIGGNIQVTPSAPTANVERSTSENIERGLGLGARVLPSAALKLPASLADLGASIVNVIPSLISKGDVALGGKPLDARLPTDATASVDDFLNEIFPEPESFGEKVVAGAGDIALTGGAGAAALAPKAGSLLRTPGSAGILKNLGDDIGEAFVKKPVTSGVLEGSGGAGAVTAGELAAGADASPIQQVLATLAGGISGVAAPLAAVNTSRRAATGITNVADNILSGERRAARTLQEAAADPEAAARAAADAPEGVLPGRATGDPELRSLEARVLADDPKLAARTEVDLEAAEARTLDELANSFGPKSDKADFQQAAIERAAAPGTKIKPGQPDEMLDDAAVSFNAAYKEAEGFPVSTQNLTDVGQGPTVSLRQTLSQATTDTGIIADRKVRKRVSEFLTGLLDDVERRATVRPRQEGTPVQIMSEDLIDMRQIVRQQLRQRSRTGQSSAAAAAEADMLQNANRAITTSLESQLPAEASTALRATDARYADFVTVQTAVLRSGEKGLTPEALRASVRATASSPGKFARGDTGDLGRIAEQGKDLGTLLGKPDQVGRAVRNMTPEQVQVAKADLNTAVLKKSETSGRLNADKLKTQLKQNRETLEAAGFTDADLKRMDRIAQELKVVQAKELNAPQALLNDPAGVVLNLFARIAGSKSGTRILKAFGGAGAGGSLILARFGSETMQKTLKSLTIDQADRVMRRAFVDKDLMSALLTKPTDALKKQADAARVINAFLLEPAKQVSDNEAE